MTQCNAKWLSSMPLGVGSTRCRITVVGCTYVRYVRSIEGAVFEISDPSGRSSQWKAELRCVGAGSSRPCCCSLFACVGRASHLSLSAKSAPREARPRREGGARYARVDRGLVGGLREGLSVPRYLRVASRCDALCPGGDLDAVSRRKDLERDGINRWMARIDSIDLMHNINH